MSELTPTEKIIYNEGERLIPGVTHALAEDIRHLSSYLFFRRVIETDRAITKKETKELRIVDLGCGVGHGCYAISKIQGVHVLGIDISPESLEYAHSHYGRPNISYQIAALPEFIPAMPEFDYVVSRGVFEHVPGGLRLALSAKWLYRLLFDVPYDEPEGGNPHHVLTGITEESFVGFPGAELFFQDLAGVIYDVRHKPPSPNMIICVQSRPELPEVSSLITFPVAACRPEQVPGFAMRADPAGVDRGKLDNGKRASLVGVARTIRSLLRRLRR